MYAHAQSPCRIGIAGGGTDLPAWTRERRGYCLTLGIATYTHAVCITRPDRQVVASYRHLDQASAATEIANGLIRESALLHGFEDGFEVHTLSEVSSLGSGLGVSSSIAVCLAAVFQRMVQMRGGAAAGDSPSKSARIAKDAWTVEISKLRRPIGRQDHMAAAYGGLRLYAFEGDGACVVTSFGEDDARWVASHLALVQLPVGHDSRAILSSATRAAQMQTASDAVPVARKAIEVRSSRLLGEALDMCQVSKEQIPGAVTTQVADVVAKVRCCAGVRGCKVAGAGGGGHLVVAVDPGSGTMDALRAATGLVVLDVAPDFHGVRSEGY